VRLRPPAIVRLKSTLAHGLAPSSHDTDSGPASVQSGLRARRDREGAACSVEAHLPPRRTRGGTDRGRADPSTVRTPRQRGQTHPTAVKRWIRTVTDKMNEWRHAGSYCWYANALLGSRVESPTPRLARPDTAAVDWGHPPYTVCGELCGFSFPVAA
jgi:hypothetical protein